MRTIPLGWVGGLEKLVTRMGFTLRLASFRLLDPGSRNQGGRVYIDISVKHGKYSDKSHMRQYTLHLN